MMINLILKRIFIFFLLTFSFEVNSKNYEKKKFICADEIGPVIEFEVPSFKNTEIEQKLIFKYFNDDDRDIFYNESGIMFKQSSPIDDSYYYYKVDTTLKNEKSKKLFFEFFPPSTLMLKKDSYMTKTLACWND